MKSQPFKRALLMAQAISAILQNFRGHEVQFMLNQLGPYESRGKGRGVYSGRKKTATSSGKYARVFNGARECARRMRQIERGIIAVSA